MLLRVVSADYEPYYPTTAKHNAFYDFDQHVCMWGIYSVIFKLSHNLTNEVEISAFRSASADVQTE